MQKSRNPTAETPVEVNTDRPPPHGVNQQEVDTCVSDLLYELEKDRISEKNIETIASNPFLTTRVRTEIASILSVTPIKNNTESEMALQHFRSEAILKLISYNEQNNPAANGGYSEWAALRIGILLNNENITDREVWDRSWKIIDIKKSIIISSAIKAALEKQKIDAELDENLRKRRHAIKVQLLGVLHERIKSADHS